MAPTSSELAGTTIGVKGKLPASIEVMLLRAGLTEGADFDTVLLDGFDPIQHIAIRRSSGSPATRATNRARSSGQASASDCSTRRLRHPRIVRGDLHERARSSTSTRPPPRTSCGPRCAASPMRIADPEAAANIAVELINANGNPNFLLAGGRSVPLGHRCRTDRRHHAGGNRLRRSRRRRCCRPNSTPMPRSGCSATPKHPTPHRVLGNDIIDARLRRRRHGHLAELTGSPPRWTTWREHLAERTARSRGPKRSGEQTSGVRDVVVELRVQRLDPVELALTAQEVSEPHAGPFAVEIARRSRGGALRAASCRRARRTSVAVRG